MPTARIFTKGNIKYCVSPEYNYLMNMDTGFFARWGKTKKDDPQFAPGPEILDIEVSTICSGISGNSNKKPTPCSHCYKSNTPRGENMSFETFKDIFDKIPPTLTQIAFGIGDIEANPDLFKMFTYCRENDHNPGVVPNVTINGYGLTDELADTLASHCGAVAVSRYNPKHVCYNAVKKLTDRRMDQINIHMLVSKETLQDCYQVLLDSKIDPRLQKLNAIVFLMLKPKGDRNQNTPVTFEQYKELVDTALDMDVRIGFDSCSAPAFLRAIKNYPNYKQLEMLSDPCEGFLFSFYISVDGKSWLCSFCENQEDFYSGDLTKISDFTKEIWFSEDGKRIRNHLLENNRHCPAYDILK